MTSSLRKFSPTKSPRFSPSASFFVGMIAEQVKDTLGQGYRVLSWEQTNEVFFNVLQVERNVMFMILSIIISAVIFVTGLFYFRHVEQTFADIV